MTGNKGHGFAVRSWLAMGVALAAAGAAGAPRSPIPYPTPDYRYTGRVEVHNAAQKNAADVQQVRDDAQKACFRMHRALYAIRHYWPEIWEIMGPHGINFPVLKANRSFYDQRLKRRLEACRSGTLKFRLVGNSGWCSAENGTEAYVKVTLGFWVHSTINVCDLWYRGGEDQRVETLAHEYGRLEGIGDSPNFDTNNIYVWDVIVRRLSEDATFEELKARHEEK